MTDLADGPGLEWGAVGKPAEIPEECYIHCGGTWFALRCQQIRPFGYTWWDSSGWRKGVLSSNPRCIHCTWGFWSNGHNPFLYNEEIRKVSPQRTSSSDILGVSGWVLLGLLLHLISLSFCKLFFLLKWWLRASVLSKQNKANIYKK